jgi:peptide/nickel transport system permease protein
VKRERARSPMLVAGLVIVGVLGAVAICGPLIAPHDPHALSGDAVERPSGRHWLGTNDIGQDILSEVVIGTRASLAVAVPAAALAVGIGLLVGAGAGIRGGTTNAVVMRAVDGFLAIPGFPLVILLAALAGPNRIAVVLIIALAGWPPMARVLNNQVLQLRGRGFVKTARGFGATPRYVIRRHIVPAVGPTLAAGFVQWAATAVVLESGLAFLGLGDPAGVSWGAILNRALGYQGLYYSSLWVWWVLPAGLAITLAALGFTFIGVGLEPAFNPRWRRAL